MSSGGLRWTPWTYLNFPWASPVSLCLFPWAQNLVGLTWGGIVEMLNLSSNSLLAVCIPLPPSVSTQPLPLLWLIWWGGASYFTPAGIHAKTLTPKQSYWYCLHGQRTSLLLFIVNQRGKIKLAIKQCLGRSFKSPYKRCYILLFLQTRAIITCCFI